MSQQQPHPPAASPGARTLPDPAPWLDGYDCGHAVGHTEGYRQGHIDGYTAGWADAQAAAADARDQAEREHATEENRRLVARLTNTRPYADLAELRGQHDRAERQRRTLRERGVA